MTVMYLGVFLLSLGTYQLLCYYFMLPTVKAVRYLSLLGNKMRICSWDAFGHEIARSIVTKFELSWDRAGEYENRLRERGMYAGIEIFIVSQFCMSLLAIFILVPMIFIHKGVFCLCVCSILLYRMYFIIKVFREDKQEAKIKVNRNSERIYKLLPGAFFISEIILIVMMFT